MPVRIKRGKGLDGAAQVELIVPSHLHGIAAEPVTIAADQSEAEFTITRTDRPEDLTMPVVLRATIMDQGDPVCAEARLTVLSEPGP